MRARSQKLRLTNGLCCLRRNLRQGGFNQLETMMHRTLAISILLFWGAVFGGFAHSVLSGNHEFGGTIADTISAMPFTQLSATMMLIVAVLFGWAVLALVTDDVHGFREVERSAYAAAIVALVIVMVAAIAKPSAMPGTASILVASLAVSAAASWRLEIEHQEHDVDVSKVAARHMALGAAHNSLLSRVSGRAAPVSGEA
jgi:cytochrome bd-type quinol oxidase subunit 2